MGLNALQAIKNEGEVECLVTTHVVCFALSCVGVIHPGVVPMTPQNEIQAKFLQDMCPQKSSDILVRLDVFADFRAAVFSGDGCKKFQEEPSTLSTRQKNKILSPRDSGSF